MKIDWHAADDPIVVRLTTAQQAELEEMAPDADAVRFPLHTDIEFAVGTLHGNPVACGALQRLSSDEAEIKRMYVAPEARRRGLARTLVVAIETRARSRGFTTLRLETGITYDGPIRLYTSCGYERSATYGEYVGNPYSACFVKRLTADQRL